MIRALLKSTPEIAAIAGDRVNFGAHPQGQPYPAILLNVVSNIEGYLINAPSGLSQARIQVDCDANDYASSKFLSRAALTALSGYSAGRIQGVFHAGSRDYHEGGSNVPDRPFRVSLDFMITYNN
nr:DUF3168 domain-containing protein [Sulfitobacter sp. M22]